MKALPKYVTVVPFTCASRSSGKLLRLPTSGSRELNPAMPKGVPTSRISDEPPNASCCEGLVYVGHLSEEDGAEVERVDVTQLWCLEG